MNKEELKKIAINLIEPFNAAGKESIDLYNQGLKIEIKETIGEYVIGNKAIV